MSTIAGVTGDSTSDPVDNNAISNVDGSLLVWDVASGTYIASDTLVVVPGEGVDLGDGDYLIGGYVVNQWNGLLAREFYVVGDSLTSPNGGTDGEITYDTDGSGNITNVVLTDAGTTFTRDFQLSTRGINSSMAWFDVTVSGGVITGVVFANQSGAFTINLTGVSVDIGATPPVHSWAYLLWNEYALNGTIDAMPATSVARPGTEYQYNAPSALKSEIALVSLGGNDAGGIDVGGGLSASGAPSDLSEATFKAAYQALLQAFLDDDYRVIVMLAPYNDFADIFTQPNWIVATDLIKEYQRDVCAILGLTEIWDYPTTNLSDGIHPNQTGHDIIRREIYPRMSAVCGTPGIINTPVTADYTSLGGEAHELIVCNNTDPITITLNTLQINHRVTVVRGNTGTVTIDGDGALVHGEATQVMPSRYDSADLIGTAIGWLLK